VSAVFCAFTPLDPVKPWRLACSQCGKQTPPLECDPESFQRVCRGRQQSPKAHGAGCHLLALTTFLGVRHPPRCKCKRLARWMDRIGPAGCRQHFGHIVDKIQANQRLWGWQDFIASVSSAAWKALKSGVAFHINPLDPIPGLVEMALQRAERGDPLIGEVTPVAQASQPSNACVYLGGEVNKPDPWGKKLRQCYLLGECMLTQATGEIPACDTCRHKLTIDRPEFATTWQDTLAVYDRRGRTTDGLRDVLAGRSIFLAGGGPSANELPLERLGRRGCWTMCINNMAGHARFRPQAMVCTDPPEKFSDAIWRDPQILKFVPTPKLVDPNRGKLRTQDEEGKCVPLLVNGQHLTTQDCPAVWGVKRREWIAIDDTFFLDDAACNGQYKAGVEKTQEPRTICTLLFAMRIARYLGAREVFLLGVDFHMDAARGVTGNYAFGQDRTLDACASNNNQYAVVNDWLCRLQSAGVFARFGISFYNCNPHSSLRAFPHVPFEMALERVCDGVEEQPRLAGWYEKEKKRKA